MAYIVILGDLVASKEITGRAAFQQRLTDTLAQISAANPAICSPYTLTLGDEFQAVYQRAAGLAADLCRVRLACLPHRVRFVISLGEIVTAINPRQAIGMDGPAFHAARAHIETLKTTDRDWALVGARLGESAARDAIIDLLGAHVETWKANRWDILHGLLTGESIPDLITRTNISSPAVYKNISHGRLESVVTLFKELESRLDAGLAR